MKNRRDFLKSTSAAIAGAFLLKGMAWPFAQTPGGIRKFVVPLQGLGPAGIPVASPNTTLFPGEDYYQIRVGEFTQQMHPDLPGPTKFWGFADVTNGQAANHRYLGGVIVAQKGRPVRMKVINQLPARASSSGGYHDHGSGTGTESLLHPSPRGIGSMDE